MISRDDSWLRPRSDRPDDNEWNSTSGVPFGEWIRRGKAGAGQPSMSEQEQQMADRIADVFRQASRPQQGGNKR